VPNAELGVDAMEESIGTRDGALTLVWLDPLVYPFP
jgi:hypothetical protein